MHKLKQTDFLKSTKGQNCIHGLIMFIQTDWFPVSALLLGKI